MASTMVFSDLYGGHTPGQAETPGPPVVQSASGMPKSDTKQPALIWVGMVIALVALRVAWEVAQ